MASAPASSVIRDRSVAPSFVRCSWAFMPLSYICLYDSSCRSFEAAAVRLSGLQFSIARQGPPRLCSTESEAVGGEVSLLSIAELRAANKGTPEMEGRWLRLFKLSKRDCRMSKSFSNFLVLVCVAVLVTCKADLEVTEGAASLVDLRRPD